MEWFFISVLISCTIAVTVSVLFAVSLKNRLKIMEDLVEEFTIKYETEKNKYKKLLSQKKSSETRLGQISENLIPFLEGCPYDPKTMHFLGNPLDYLVFDLDEGKVVFLEIKSGNSRASKKQKTIKSLIQKGHVYYEEMRINEKGIKSKKAKNS
jgi:predicted Holliday junction resolvase-like endonuclease